MLGYRCRGKPLKEIYMIYKSSWHRYLRPINGSTGIQTIGQRSIRQGLKQQLKGGCFPGRQSVPGVVTRWGVFSTLAGQGKASPKDCKICAVHRAPFQGKAGLGSPLALQYCLVTYGVQITFFFSGTAPLLQT